MAGAAPQIVPGVALSTPSSAPQMIILQANGPSCTHSIINTSFTGCGIATAILLFPVGLLCCLLKQQKRCGKCGVLLESGC